MITDLDYCYFDFLIHQRQKESPLVIQKSFFDLANMPKLVSRTWTPLRLVSESTAVTTTSGVISVSEYVATATAAIHQSKAAIVDSMKWADLGLDPHHAGMEAWGYRSADVFRGWGEEDLGINLVIAQHLEAPSQEVWHLHPDVVVALHLTQEGDRWYRPEEGWPEVVRLTRDDNGKPISIQIKTEFLNDYLVARAMRLFCSSYSERVAITDHDPGYGWSPRSKNVIKDRDELEFTSTPANWPHPPGSFFTRGAIWRTEWLDPGTLSPRIRGDKVGDDVSFVTKSDGTRVSAGTLNGDPSWLYFEPGVINALLRHRGGRLRWATRDTGGVGATSDIVHFGVNELGLVTVFAKDIGMLQTWEQRVWAAHNVTPDGSVGEELFAAQMMVRPASTSAPEAILKDAVEGLDRAFKERYGKHLLRENHQAPELVSRSHRFRAVEQDGLLELAKQLTQLIVEPIDVDVVLAQCPPLDKGDRKPGSLKAVERLLSTLLAEDQAKQTMAPLFGLYDLRNASAHLGSSLISSGMQRVGIDDRLHSTEQGLQMLEGIVSTLHVIARTLNQPKSE